MAKHIEPLLVFFLILVSIKSTNAASNISCIKSERDALLMFKNNLDNHTQRLLSWVGEDCCTWGGVNCSNTTGHVVKLDVQQSELEGEINPSLFNLSNLRYLALNLNGFRGFLPSEWSNLKFLSVLDLSDNELEGEVFRSLLGGVHGSLKTLNLQGNKFIGSLPYEIGEFKQLEYLRLSSNSFHGPIPESIGLLPNLIELSLSDNYFNGSIPESLGQLSNLRSLEYLFLSSNSFHGPIPESIGLLPNLIELSLSDNYFNGSIPESLGQLSNLRTLDVSNNSLGGLVTEIHFSKLKSLINLAMEDNPFAFDFDPTWIPPFQLTTAYLSSCKIGPEFPQWLKTQNIEFLEMSNASISNAIPYWFENISSNLLVLDLSHNQIEKALPKLRKMTTGVPFRRIYLHSNKFEGPLTPFPSDVTELDVSNNFLSGNIPETIGDNMPNLRYFYLSYNHFNGSIPVSFCKMKDLEILDLSNNQLSGRLPRCHWQEFEGLEVMDLANNNFSGHIPASFGSLTSLVTLHLENNNLQGKIPTSLNNLTNLCILDLSQNSFVGSIPPWMGENLSSLRILNAHSNMFTGEVPIQLCRLPFLHILNLANNNLSGNIPTCFDNFTAMILGKGPADDYWGVEMFFYTDMNHKNTYAEHVLTFIKGTEREYNGTLRFLFSIDLSANNLVGEFPMELCSLSRLQNLNLSGNSLKGQIPVGIGSLKSMESLDLSRNEFSGSIPPSISSLNFLSHLNLSFNNLSGRIPSGNQLQTLDDKSIYVGNENLCGPPLQTCPENELPKGEVKIERGGESEFEIRWFYSGLGMGLVSGFVGVCSVLYFKDSWRNRLFKSVDKVSNKVWIAIALKANRLQR